MQSFGAYWKCYSSCGLNSDLKYQRALPTKHLERVSEGKHVLLCVDFYSRMISSQQERGAST